tara:strand:+ start:7259 stop:8911 length:1653 start_codon:yes stop_codon:yes gene_type:complete
MKKVVYTAIFGGYDTLLDPKSVLPGVDYICYTDSNITSDIWQIKKVPAMYGDSTRCARKYKLLPHRYLKEYDVSLWVDGNINIHGNIDDFIESNLRLSNIAVYDHMQCFDKRNCIYQEAQAIFYFGNKNGNFKDNPVTIQKQMERYLTDSYPEQNGLISSGVILRKHNSTDVIDCMEHWWNEVKYGSKRDQLSFNYSAWKTELKYTWIHGDIRDNNFVKLIGKHAAKDKLKKFQPIDVDYFLNMELAGGGGGKEIVKLDGKLITVRDVVEYFSSKYNRTKTEALLKPENWQYYNCMIAEFRHGVENHHDLGWENMTKEYYNNLELMTDPEIEDFLKSTPVEFDNGFIRHNYHRACAMIGRLIAGKPYIPFYMKTSQIYAEPRKRDGIHRVKHLTNNVYGIDQIKLLPIPESDYTITQSGILALMGIRKNDDIDIIISSKVRKNLFNNRQDFIKLPGNIEIFEPNRGKFLNVDGVDDDDLIANHSIIVNGVRFLHPKFYFSRKRTDRESDKYDWACICEFFELKRYKGFPFNTISLDQWGHKYIKNYMEVK